MRNNPVHITKLKHSIEFPWYILKAEAICNEFNWNLLQAILETLLVESKWELHN